MAKTLISGDPQATTQADAPLFTSTEDHVCMNCERVIQAGEPFGEDLVLVCKTPCIDGWIAREGAAGKVLPKAASTRIDWTEDDNSGQS